MESHHFSPSDSSYAPAPFDSRLSALGFQLSLHSLGRVDADVPLTAER